MFAVLLWALRVHTFSAAARFSFTRYADFVPDSILSVSMRLVAMNVAWTFWPWGSVEHSMHLDTATDLITMRRGRRIAA